MPAAYMWLFGTWLPQSGREAADAPVFEDYLNSPSQTPPSELLTDVYLPLLENCEAFDGPENMAPEVSGSKAV
jgi:predicted transcriptional regulator YdeE